MLLMNDRRRKLCRLATLLLAVVFGALTQPAGAQTTTPDGDSQKEPSDALPGAAGTPQDAWARVLERYVDDSGRVDFAGIARDRVDLDRFVEWAGSVGPNNSPELFPGKADVLAYHINAYNALALHSVLDAGIPDSLGGLKKLSFFVFRKVRVGGEMISLRAYENDIIRPLGDERVHFALNCMVVGCPRLPRMPFHADMLDAELDQSAQYFFSEPRNLALDEGARTVRLSEILKFYTDDFLAKAPSLIAYANRYRAEPIGEDYRVEFISYDWTVNRQKP